jgi:hypothetical protein
LGRARRVRDHRLVTGGHGRPAEPAQEATMRTTRATVAAVLLAAAGLAGCTGGQPATPAPAADTTTSPTSTSTSAPTSASTAPVTTASTGPFPGIWDVRTWDQAGKVQRAVDDGHQPWRLDPAAVVAAYASGALGVTGQPVVKRAGAGSYTVAAPGGAAVATVRVAQPLRQGPGGIWVVTAVDRSSAGAGQAACSPAAILPLLKRKFDNPAGGLVIVKADVVRCRNGYARVFAVPRQNPAGQSQYDREQLFLRSVKGAWTSVAEGTGITCDDADITAAMLAACRALGYRT